MGIYSLLSRNKLIVDQLLDKVLSMVFMPANAGKLKLVTQSVDGFCIITIEDNGIGIANENLA